MTEIVSQFNELQTDFAKKVEDAKSELERAQKALIEKIKPQFITLFMPAFNKHPKLEAFRWRQYTPYFSDGDPCVFSVHDIAIKHEDLKGEGSDGFLWGIPAVDIFTVGSWGYDREWTAEARAEALKNFGSQEAYLDLANDMQTISDAFHKLPKEIMEDMFGDHMEITVTREGIEVEEYSHD